MGVGVAVGSGFGVVVAVGVGTGSWIQSVCACSELHAPNTEKRASAPIPLVPAVRRFLKLPITVIPPCDQKRYAAQSEKFR
ncbi:MAG TPA: hypothetical protein DCS07_06640 [Bdellovibrionales bacterium]|nr:hypothetical protein [Bdellovibrionales bacterium]HCM39227.1 hypothetical protein [Bdellovibrionales bacterium]